MSMGRFMTAVGKMMVAPAVRFINQTISQSYHPRLEAFFYTIGKYMYCIKLRIDSVLITNSRTNLRPKELERSKLVAYGAEKFFGTFCIYGIAITLLVREVKKSIKATKKQKDEKIQMNNAILKLREDFNTLQTHNAALIKKILVLEEQLNYLLNKQGQIEEKNMSVDLNKI